MDEDKTLLQLILLSIEIESLSNMHDVTLAIVL